MITFTARMYDATHDTWLDDRLTNYTMAYYNFDSNIDTVDQYNQFVLDTSRLDYSQSSNFAAQMIYALYTHNYNDPLSPIYEIRLCISGKESNYFSYQNGSYNIFACVSPQDRTVLINLGLFTMFNNEEPTLSRCPIAWVNKQTTEGINPTFASGVVFGSVYRGVSDGQLLNLETATVSVQSSLAISGDSSYIISKTGEVLCHVGTRTFTKYNSELAVAAFVNRTGSFKGPFTIGLTADSVKYNAGGIGVGYSGKKTTQDAKGISREFHYTDAYWLNNSNFSTSLPTIEIANNSYTALVVMDMIIEDSGLYFVTASDQIYAVMVGTPMEDEDMPTPDEPNVNPDDIPNEDEQPEPSEPDSPDPYYDPTSDPTSPDYDPTKDPNSPNYDPTNPNTPFNPPSNTSSSTPQTQTPQDRISTPETPPSYVTTNDMFTLYNPSGGDLTNIANFLWSPTWSIDTFKKIFANPLDCILGLMVMPLLGAAVSTKVMNIGNISSGVTLHYFTSQFYDFDCGTFLLKEFYAGYLDYSPYTKVLIYLPFIGYQRLNTDEVMNKTIGVKYRFDIATGDCVAFVTVEGDVLYSFAGNCAARLPLSGNNWGGMISSITAGVGAVGSMAAGVPALGAASALAVTSMKEDIQHSGSLSGSAGLMGIQTPYLIVTRPRQALPINQNSYTGYPSFITESLASLSGYTEIEQCHIENVPATMDELKEIETLLKGGVLF